MIQDIYQKAIRFAGEKHRDQRVPGSDANYLLHLSNVAMEIFCTAQKDGDFDLNYAITLALLHDTLEDTDTSFDELKDEFGERVALGVLALTKKDHLGSKRAKMDDSLKRICEREKEVGMVKLADRITNLQQPPKHWSQEKIANYFEESKRILSALSGKHQGLEARLEAKIAQYQNYIEIV